MAVQSTDNARSGETEAVVIIKAAPQIGQRHGETVCCAGIDLNGNWLRLYPVSFRTLDDGKKFSRWDRIKFRWRLPNDDRRVESRRIDQDTISIIGKLKPADHERFLSRLIVTSLDRERQAGRSLALLRAQILEFKFEAKPAQEMTAEKENFNRLRAQPDLFKTKAVIPYAPCPYKFKYRYKTEDGLREGTCQDWEVEATHYHWTRKYGNAKALDRMQQIFGVEYPKKGMLLAMGTHSQYPDTWLINGVIRYEESGQMAFL